MIIKIREGRFGNQIHQYLALQAICQPGERIVLIDFQELFHVFENIQALRVNIPKIGGNKIRKILLRLLKLIEPFSGDGRAFGKIYQDRDAHFVPRRQGKNCLTLVVTDSYFPTEEAISGVSKHFLPVIKPRFVEEANLFLNQQEANRPIVFIHIRRGDYLTWPSAEFPAALPEEWYLRAINVARKDYNNPLFIVVSDDTNYCRSFLPIGKDFVLSENSWEVDFAIMTLCNGGILSASTFAWWAARLTTYPSGNFYGPKYWLGHASRRWDPHSQSSFIRYLV